MGNAQELRTLTPTQRKALRTACATGIRPVDIGESVKLVTIVSLEARGLVHLRTNRRGRKLWRTTDTGRGLVASSGLLPTFLHRRSEYGYTHTLAQAMLGEPEVIL